MNHESQENEALSVQMSKETGVEMKNEETNKNGKKGNVFSDKTSKAYDKQINV